METMKLGNPRSVESISGNVSLTEFDNVPSNSRVVHHHKLKPPRRGLFMTNVATPLWEFSNSVTLNIPEEEVYERKEGVRYDESQEPVAANDFIVPDTEILAYQDIQAAKFAELKDGLYDTAALLDSLAESNEYVQAALRDGADLRDYEADSGIYESFVHISRLTTISQIVKLTTMPEHIKTQYMEKICELLAQESVSSMTSHDKRSTFRKFAETVHDNHARVRPQEEVDNPNALGVRRSRIG